jgi:hypothetical protein
MPVFAGNAYRHAARRIDFLNSELNAILYRLTIDSRVTRERAGADAYRCGPAAPAPPLLRGRRLGVSKPAHFGSAGTAANMGSEAGALKHRIRVYSWACGR